MKPNNKLELARLLAHLIPVAPGTWHVPHSRPRHRKIEELRGVVSRLRCEADVIEMLLDEAAEEGE